MTNFILSSCSCRTIFFLSMYVPMIYGFSRWKTWETGCCTGIHISDVAWHHRCCWIERWIFGAKKKWVFRLRLFVIFRGKISTLLQAKTRTSRKINGRNKTTSPRATNFDRYRIFLATEAGSREHDLRCHYRCNAL